MTDIIGVYIPAGAKPCRIVKLPRKGFNEAVYKLLDISCYDIVRLPMDDRTIMLVDDEGLLRDSPYNARASILSRYPCGLVGDALVVGVGMVDGEQDVVGLDPHLACNLITVLTFGEDIWDCCEDDARNVEECNDLDEALCYDVDEEVQDDDA